MRILFVFVLLAGAQARAASGGPCVLTKAEIQEAAGITVSDGAVNTTNKAVCDYKIAGSASIMNISLTDKGPGDSPQKMVAELNKRKMKAEIVSGIGDGAYHSAPGYGMQQMGAFKGSKHVIVTVLMMGAEAKAKAAADKLIRKAVSKL